MPIEAPAATSQPEAATEAAELNALLNLDGTTDGKGTAEAVETEEPAETEEAVETAEVEEVAEEVEEVADEAAETTEEADEESELALDEGDRDYSDSAYKKAAEFYSKKLKVQFDPNDAKDRVTLSRLLQDRDALAAQRAEIEAAKAEETDEAEPAETKDAVPDAAQRAERVKAAITNLQSYAKTRIVPEVAMHLSNRLGKALWGKEFDSFPQEQANEISEVFTEMGYHLLNDSLESLKQQIFSALGADPIMTRVTTMAVREGAFEYLDGLKDSAGTARYPDLERMVDRGDIQKALKDNPWIAKSSFDEKDPIRREAKRIEAAYKIARGETVIPQVTKAVQTGKKQAEAAARARGAARVAPGKTKGPIGQQPTEGEQLVTHLTTSRRGRFSGMLSEGKNKSA